MLLGEIARDGVGMINKKNVCVVLPAYNAARTLERTLREIPTYVLMTSSWSTTFKFMDGHRTSPPGHRTAVVPAIKAQWRVENLICDRGARNKGMDVALGH